MKYETRLIAILTFTFGFVFFDRNAANFLMPFIAKDLSFTNQQIGLIQSALSFTWAVSASSPFRCVPSYQASPGRSWRSSWPGC